MKNLPQCLAGWLLLAGVMQPHLCLAQGTAFTFQGQLVDGGSPANAKYDLTFAVWDAVSGGNRLGGPLTNAAVTISNGLFTVSLDYGAGIFTGLARWLEIGVRPQGGGAFTVLAPRQACTPAPYAIDAANAGAAATVTGSVSASQISGTLAPSNIGAGLITAGNLAPNAAAANLNAAGQSGVASSGLVLSTTDNNTNLINAGYVKIYGSFGTPDLWQSFTNPPVTPAPTARKSHTAVWTGAEMIIWGGYGNSYLNDGGRYNPAVDSWTALPVVAGSTPAARLNHTAVWTGGEMIVWGGVGGTNYFNDGGLYDPILNSWTYLPGSLPNSPAARLQHIAVWTGSRMFVWGGLGGSSGDLNDGGLYDPGLNQWTYVPNSLANTPGPRTAHTAVWTGTEVIVWGGYDTTSSSLLSTGGRYNPTANSWITVATAGAPAAREAHSAVWTGTEMIVWGGTGSGGGVNDGGRYNPTGNSWIAIANGLANTPVARENHTAVWSGTEMVVWGGYSDSGAAPLNNGGRFNPASGSWIAIAGSLANTPAARFEHTAVWSGTEMIVWGGVGGSPLNDGGRYNPAANTWRYLPNSAANVPSPRAGHTAVWSGSEMIVWGGTDGNSYFNDGGRFNPAVNNWLAIPNSLSNAPAGRQYHTAVWTGTEMIVWGGVNNGGFLNDGGRFNPASNAWTALPGSLANAPAARDYHSVVWTGTEMIVWGGSGLAGILSDGGRFNPALGSWTSISGALANAPTARASHTAVWSGLEMVVWGGASNATCYADGGRYNPALGSWIYLSNSIPNTPAARSAQTAVWTGTEMIVWGGIGCGSVSPLNDGGRYNPASNIWTSLPNTLPNTPAARMAHTAVWTGLEMIVWGGSGATTFGDGGRYNPALNSWNSISATLANAPAARALHTSVWTGNMMLVWGGLGTAYYNDTSGYTPGRNLYLYQRP